MLQLINVVDNPNFWQLLTYISGRICIVDDIPHQTKFTSDFVEAWKQERKGFVDEMKVSWLCITLCTVFFMADVLWQSALGRVSLTTDAWSTSDITLFVKRAASAWHYGLNSLPFYIYKVHILVSTLEKSCLRLFVRWKLWIAWVGLISDCWVQHECTLWKVGPITVDNTSNNNMMMWHLETLFQAAGTPFNQNGNHVRYLVFLFPVTACLTQNK